MALYHMRGKHKAQAEARANLRDADRGWKRVDELKELLGQLSTATLNMTDDQYRVLSAVAEDMGLTIPTDLDAPLPADAEPILKHIVTHHRLAADCRVQILLNASRRAA
jgi:hypothetical protein